MDLQTLLALGVLSFDALNAYINNLPRISTRLADMRLFQEDGLVGTTIVKVGSHHRAACSGTAGC